VIRVPRRLRALLAQPRNLRRLGLIAAAFVSGLVAVGYARLFKVTEAFTTELFRAHPFWLLAAAPACFAGGWYLVHHFAPGAGGSGIPQVMAAIELEQRQPGSVAKTRLLGLRVSAVKVLSSLLCVATGGAVGREGPTLQVAASVFLVMGTWVRRFTRVSDMETWLLAGSAAGLGAAFNTPLGGIVYAIEELASKHFTRVRTAVLTSVLVAGLVSQWLVGSYLYLGFPTIGKVGLRAIPAAFVVGIAGGLLGAAFGKGLFRARYLILSRFQGSPARTGLLVALGCALLLTGLRFVDDRALGPGNRLVSRILSGETTASAELVGARVLSSTVSYLSGCAGGVFAPCLAIGASMGSWVSTWWHGTGAVLLTLLGMIAVLTGFMRAPFTSFVLILEMTDRHSAIFPMMLTALVATGSARLVGGTSFYEQVKQSILLETRRSRPPE
jgi:H+/Cl- antiporter ClcA